MTVKDTPLVDPVSLSVIGNALVAICEEMSAAIVRAAYSSIVREGRDCSTALLDEKGRVVAQSHRIPIQMNSLSLSFRWLVEHGRLEAIEADDVLMTNDPYCGAQHLNDIVAFAPIFWNGRLIGYAGSTIHATDIGGPTAAINTTATDIFGEGLRIPGLRLKRLDVLDGWFAQMIRSNVRVPDEVIGDLGAQLAANRLGSIRYVELIERYGTELVQAVEEQLMDYAERRVRAEIESLPDGDYTAEDCMDHDGFEYGPYPVRAALRVRGSDLTIDFSGSSDQLRGPNNSPLAATLAGAYSFVAAYLLRDSTFTNEGCFRAINVIVPYGSLLNPRPPAPVLCRSNTANRAYSTLKFAFARIRPEGVLAGGQDTPCQFALHHLGERGYQIMTGAAMGGWGAAPDADGQDALSQQMSNATNLPVEYEETNFRFYRIVNYGLIPDSAGQGRFRGGLGQRRTYEILADDVVFAAYTDRFMTAPRGLFGGKPGRLASFTVVRSGERISLPPLVSNYRLKRGDLLIIDMAGGAGYGNPEEREAALTQRDIDEGRVTAN